MNHLLLKKSRHQLFLTLLCIVGINLIGFAQVDCELNDVIVRITKIEGASIVKGRSSINSARPAGLTVGDSLEITAERCGEITIEVTLSYDWTNGDEDIAWLHGISFLNSSGWSSSEAGTPGPGWDYYDSITGCCSNDTYTDGYFYEDSGFANASSCNTNSGCCDQNDFNCQAEATDNEDPDDPSDNWGIDCESQVCPDFSFELKFCPSVSGTQGEDFGFIITNDGDSGGWTLALGCYYELKFPIKINSAGIPLVESGYGPDCPGSCYEITAGEGCSDYLWNTGETTSSIVVCPEKDSTYSVEVRTSCSSTLNAEFPILTMSCCPANAGILPATDTLCSQEQITIDVLGENIDSLIETQIIIVNLANNKVVYTGPSQTSWAYDSCGEFAVYSYNFDYRQNLPSHLIDQEFQFYDCINNCCDYSQAFLLSVIDTLPPVISIPVISDVADLTEYNNLFSQGLPTISIDNCIGIDTITPQVSGLATLCDGGKYFWTYVARDSCNNVDSLIIELIIPPSLDCSCFNVSPPLPNNYSECLIPNIHTLSVSDDGVNEIDWYNQPIGGQLIEANSSTISVSIANSGSYKYYAETVSSFNSACKSGRVPVCLEVSPEPTITNLVLSFCLELNQLVLQLDELDVLQHLAGLDAYEFYANTLDRETRTKALSFPLDYDLISNEIIYGLVLDNNLCSNDFEVTINLVFQIERQINSSICQGDSILYNQQWISESGIYNQVLSGAASCDTLETFTVDILETSEDTLDLLICSGDSIRIDNSWISNAGLYPAYFKNSKGCDSTIYNKLVVYPSYIDTTTQIICRGDSIAFNNQWLDDQGYYSESYKSQNGCDSIKILQIIIDEPISDLTNNTICKGDSIYFIDQWLSAAGLYTEVLEGTTCDTMKILNLEVAESYELSTGMDLCKGEVFFVDGTSVMESGTYTANYISKGGCDSLVIYDINFFPTHNDTLSSLLCQGDSLQLGSEIFTSSNFYSQNLITKDGCDSIVNHQITFFDNYIDTIDYNICDGDTLVLGLQVITAASSFIQEFQTAEGCDSTKLVNISFSPSLAETIEKSLCAGDTLFVGDEYYLEAGTYEQKQLSSRGCDSLVTIYLETIDIKTIDLEDQVLKTNERLEILLDLDSLIYDVLWDPIDFIDCSTCFEVTISPKENTTVSGTLTEVDSGCTSYFSFEVTIEKDLNVYIPNVINLNESANRVWEIYADAELEELECYIYDRWGTLVFYLDTKEGPWWDGTMEDNEVEQGVYTYFVKVTLDSEDQQFVGDLTLFK